MLFSLIHNYLNTNEAYMVIVHDGAPTWQSKDCIFMDELSSGFYESVIMHVIAVLEFIIFRVLI